MYNVKILKYHETGEEQYEFYEKPVTKRRKKFPWEEQKVIEDAEEKERNNSQNRKRSLRRTKQEIYNIARANKFEWFVTLTVSPEKADRTNIAECFKKLKNQIDWNLRRKNEDMQYVIVPELHQDGQTVHFHALFKGIHENQLKEAINPKSGEKIIVYDKQQGIKQVYNWTSYKLGFSTAIKVTEGSSARMANYMINQYLTEGLFIRAKGKKRYMISKGLINPEVIKTTMTEEEQNRLKEQIKKNTVHVKTVKVDTAEYKNVIEYYQVLTTP